MIATSRLTRFVVLALALAAVVLFAGTSVASPPARAVAQAMPTLDPHDIPKYQEPLTIPPVMPPAASTPVFDMYRIAIKQFEQQILPAGFPSTTVWGYGAATRPGPGLPHSTFNFPAFTVETRTNHPILVQWINDLVDQRQNFLPHLLPVDQTLHWANPPGPPDSSTENPELYTGPVPIVTHVHGAHVDPVSDGYPEAWYLPNAKNIPAGYYTEGSHYGSVKNAPPGSAWFEYRNDQRAATLWYHDHALGITRLNVYAGLAGFWIIRDDVEDALDLPGPAPRLGDPPGTRYYEIPIVVQDRSFKADGSLFYPDSREFFDGITGPYIPDGDIPPVWNPEFFGNTIVVNGKTWPYLDVEPRLYRFRFLNGASSRFLILKFSEPLQFHQIGSEGGLLPGAPVVLNELLMAPAERADVIVDFSAFQPGDEIILQNVGPDAPFRGLPIDPEELADPNTTGQVMKFRVVELTDQGNPGQIPVTLPPISALGPPDETRDLTLNEEMSMFADGPIAAKLGTGRDGALAWMDEITENPALNSTEVWRLINLTEDAHPIHLHQVMFRVLDRIPIDAEAYAAAQEAYIAGGKAGDPPDPLDFATGAATPPEAWETGWKDTVIALPGWVTRITARFDIAGLYVWHCHILEHEDNEMMRPYFVGAMP
ncbi:MAG: multicopper oxidase [Dehalococcoidia bacterium]|nr:multicopper oxidase [Dehalococcoidia bacterium]